MYWTKLRLTSQIGPVDLFKVGATPADLFILKGVDGLGPPEQDVSISNTVGQGGVYQNKRSQLREIVCRIGLNPDYAAGTTPSDLRSYFYSMMTGGVNGPSMSVILMDDTGGVDTFESARTMGYIKKCEVNPFSKDPEVQITIACESAYLYDSLPTHVDTSGLDKANPIFQNAGTAPTGMTWDITLTAYFDHAPYPFRIQNQNNSAWMEINYDLLPDDRLQFSTVPGARYIQIQRPGEGVINLLSALTSNSTWLQLHALTNEFDLTSGFYDWNDLFYVPQYWGI